MSVGKKSNELGEFLRARRTSTEPDPDVITSGRRRTTGMRREEVAALAGVSKDYYTRLEQGRERYPSDQVLDAIALALRLDAEARAHLLGLVRRQGAARYRRTWSQEVGPDLVRLMAGWTDTPAMVLSRCLDVLAANALARVLFSHVRPGDNLLRFIFLHPASRCFYPQWQEAARDGVGALRAAAGADSGDPRLILLVAELAAGSEEFRRLWDSHYVRGKTSADKEFHHPGVGEFTLTYETLAVSSTPGQQLVVYQAEPGSSSETALRLLSTLTEDTVASGRQARP
ncbi:helix-turn-helix transcriptional regulator [Streptomyces sp. NPDC006923]|uniref:helix-turn-helix transcriptional regulator n=1 Tax=Streptomyces sp. NPDC006923 TaxID=3155355 RepID=UPI0033EC0EB9